jgi:uncharacterized membrane protein YhaH (DUF805 family)
MRWYLQSWFPFHGRIGRAQYWIWTLLYAAILPVSGVTVAVLGALYYKPPDDSITNRTIIGFVTVAFLVLTFGTVTGLASTGVRRLHDRGKTGYWLLLYYLLPFLIWNNARMDAVGFVSVFAALGVQIWAIVDLGALPGEAGSNAFGPNPLAENPAATSAWS